MVASIIARIARHIKSRIDSPPYLIRGVSMEHPGENLDADLPPIGRDGYRHRVEWQGERLKVQTFQMQRPKRKPGKREECEGFSQSSRKRMLELVSSVDWHAAGTCHFLTLTYPDHYEGMHYRQMGMHRSMFWREMENMQQKHLSVLWRIEWKVRQSGKLSGKIMPHVHCILFREKHILNWDVNEFWMRAIGWDAYVNTDVEKMRTRKQVGIYVAKYCAKLSPILGIASNHNRIPPGRAWGKLRSDGFPLAKIRVGVFRDSSMMDWVREKGMLGSFAYEEYGIESFTLLGPLAKHCGYELFNNFVDGEIPCW